MTDENAPERPRLGLDHPTVVPRNFEERTRPERDDGSRRRRLERTDRTGRWRRACLDRPRDQRFGRDKD